MDPATNKTKWNKLITEATIKNLDIMDSKTKSKRDHNWHDLMTLEGYWNSVEEKGLRIEKDGECQSNKIQNNWDCLLHW